MTTLVDDLTREHRTVTGRTQAGAPGPIVSTRLSTELKRCSTELEALRDRLSTTLNVREAWDEFQQLRDVATDLFGESLAIALAPLVRTTEIDRQMCPVADRLLHSISTAFSEPWPHFTTVSESEYFGTTAQLIRIRYPVHVWDLPIAVHEFGHFFGPRWRTTKGAKGYATFLKRSGLGSDVHGQELFADLFAVFWLGPAYACTCILRRFNPAEADNGTHPSHRTRATWILSCLDRLIETAQEDSVATIRNVRSQLSDYWQQALVDSGLPRQHEREAAIVFGAQRLWRSLLQDYRDAVYSTASAALLVLADFREGRSANEVRGRHRLRDILNGMWLLRLRHDKTPATPSAALDEWGTSVCIGATE